MIFPKLKIPLRSNWRRQPMHLKQPIESIHRSRQSRHFRNDTTLELLDRYLLIRVDAEGSGNRHRLFCDLAGFQIGVVNQGGGGGLGGDAAGTDANQTVVRLDHVPITRDEEHPGVVYGNHHGLQAPEVFVGAPVTGKLHRGTHQVAVVAFQFGFELLGEVQGIGRRTGKTDDDLVIVNPPDFAGMMLDDGTLQRYLPVSGNHRVPLVPDGQNCGPACFHGSPSPAVHRHSSRPRGFACVRPGTGTVSPSIFSDGLCHRLPSVCQC